MIKPKDIARALAESMELHPEMSSDEACDSAIRLLKRVCPGVPLRHFVKVLERELKKRGTVSSGLLIVPTEASVSAAGIAGLVEQKSGKKVSMERKTDPELIGGAVLLIDHRRIDCSIQGALAVLLKTCLQPLH